MLHVQIHEPEQSEVVLNSSFPLHLLSLLSWVLFFLVLVILEILFYRCKGLFGTSYMAYDGLELNTIGVVSRAGKRANLVRPSSAHNELG